MHRSEFLKEKNRSKTNPTVNAGPSTSYGQTMSSASAGSSLSPQEPTPEPSIPQIKPYVRKRPRDASNDILSESSKVPILSSSLSSLVEGEGSGTGLKEVAAMDLDSATVSLEVKPYVRKRKIKPKCVK